MRNPLCTGQKREGNQVFLLSFESLIFPLRSPSLSFRKLHGHFVTAGIRVSRCQVLGDGGVSFPRTGRFCAAYFFVGFCAVSATGASLQGGASDFERGLSLQISINLSFKVRKAQVSWKTVAFLYTRKPLARRVVQKKARAGDDDKIAPFGVE